MNLIPRNILFSNTDIADVQISPDGKQISYIRPDDCSIMHVAPRKDPFAPKKVALKNNYFIKNYRWSYAENIILFINDPKGDENYNIFSLNIDTGATLNLTPFKNISAFILRLSSVYKEEILVLINDKRKEYHNIYRINIKTAESHLIYDNSSFKEFYADNLLKIRYASKIGKDGSNSIYKMVHNEPKDLFIKIPFTDSMTTAIYSMDEANEDTFMISSIGRNTKALVRIIKSSKKEKIISSDSKSDIFQIVSDPITGQIDAVSYFYLKKKWKIVNKRVLTDIKYLQSKFNDDFDISDRSMDMNYWIVKTSCDTEIGKYYLYQRKNKKIRFLYSCRSQLGKHKFAQMKSVIIKARDGLDLISYVTIPSHIAKNKKGYPKKPVPMILLVHGGPFLRDYFGYNVFHQWLANRHYAVLSVNFRGSVGFGKDFINKSIKEWGHRMQQDLIDAVKWAVDQEIADPKKIAICGQSYGGYAALMGLACTPDLFACGVDVCGPTDLISFFNSIPPYWNPMIEQLTRLIGDFRTKKGKKLLERRSPITYVDSLRKPLLIAQGKNDARVKKSESDKIIKILMKRKVNVLYLLYLDEGHEIFKFENNMSFYALTEMFLAKYLGGRYETLNDELEQSSVQIQCSKKYAKYLEIEKKN